MKEIQIININLCLVPSDIITAAVDDREFTQIEELEKLSDDELSKIVIEGKNLHIHTSRASVAKRILEERRFKNPRQVSAWKRVIKWLIYFLITVVFVGILVNLTSDWIGANILKWP